MLRDIDFWSMDESDEELHAQTLEDAVDQVTDEQLERGEIVLHGFRRSVITEKDEGNIAAGLVEHLSESVLEPWAPLDDDADIPDEVAAACDHLAKTIREHFVPWICEPVVALRCNVAVHDNLLVVLPKPEDWLCQCGARGTMDADWRWNGNAWEHYHDHPMGHAEAQHSPKEDDNA